jgi:hypothetical protein
MNLQGKRAMELLADHHPAADRDPPGPPLLGNKVELRDRTGPYRNQAPIRWRGVSTTTTTNTGFRSDGRTVVVIFSRTLPGVSFSQTKEQIQVPWTPRTGILSLQAWKVDKDVRPTWRRAFWARVSRPARSHKSDRTKAPRTHADGSGRPKPRPPGRMLLMRS